VLNDLTSTFDPLSPVTFRFERLETNPRFAAIARPANAAVLARLRGDMEDRGGRLELLLPYATLEPVRDLLLQRFMGEKFGRDSIWETHLSGELWQTEVPIDAVLDEFSMSSARCWLGTRFAPGAGYTPNSPVGCAAAVQLFRGTMGRRGGHIAVQIQDRLMKL
jgi:flagellar motor switch protein FliM